MYLAARRLFLLLALLVIASVLAVGCGGSSSDDAPKGDDAQAETADDDSSDDAEDADATEEDEDSDSEVAVDAGIAYEDAILPLVGQLKPLLERMDTTSDKLVAGSIDVARGAEAFGKQGATARQLAAKVRAVEIDDAYLKTANEHLATSIDSYADAMDVFTTFNDGMSEAQIQATFDEGMGHLGQMLTSLESWGSALEDDPDGRAFTRTGTKVVEIGEYIENL